MVDRLLTRLRLGPGWFADVACAPVDQDSGTAVHDHLCARGWTGIHHPANTVQESNADSGAIDLDATLRLISAPREFSLLRLDCLGEDYAHFASLMNHHPKLVVCRFNASIPFDTHFVQQFGSRIGCALKSLIALAAVKGFAFVDAVPNHASFIRAELADSAGLDIPDPQRVMDDYALPRLARAMDGSIIEIADGRLR